QGQRCRQCGVIAHDKCIVNVTWACSEQVSTGAHLPLETTLRSPTENMGTVAHNETLRSDGDGITHTLTLNHGTNLSSHNTVPLHKGYLSKKGAKFKLWAPRWFELEANSHKMYYYESEHELECRGYIDLCDVGSVEVETNGNKAILEVFGCCVILLEFLKLQWIILFVDSKN
uniref:PH domain-containing protein n=1 Tax=Angiostrongylus cantonensis TaxID=6313 RepID=A0A0K0D7R6_ANGCA